MALVVAGSILLASKGIFAKSLYAKGLDFETVVAVRALLAIPGFILIVIFRDGGSLLRASTRADFLTAMLAGLVCYYAGATANFYALTLIDASVERALLFTYPAMVVMVMWIISGTRPGPVMATAVVATYIGIALAVGAFSREMLQQNLVGALWVLLCSATIAYYFIVSGRLTRSMGSSGFTVVAMTAAGIALAIQYQIRHGWQNVNIGPDSWVLMVGLVVFATVLPLYLVAEGVRRIGAERAAVASSVGPPAAAVMAILLLGERLAVGQVVGIVLIVSGILLLELRQSQKKTVVTEP